MTHDSTVGPRSLAGEREYIDLIAELGRIHHQDPLWWATAVSSKNFGACPLWERIREKVGGTWMPGPSMGLGRLLRAATYQLRRSLLAAGMRSRLDPFPSPDVLFVTHLDARIQRGGAGSFHDDYWQSLPAHLTRRGLTWAVVGIVAGDDSVVARHLTTLPPWGPDVRAVLGEVELSDVALALVRALRARWRPTGPVVFRGVDIGPVLVEQFERDRLGGSMLETLLLGRAFETILTRRRPRAVFWPWENHSWEKLLVLARDRVAPAVKLIGHQHATLPPSLLNLFPGRAEVEYAPYPDRILTVGPRSLDILSGLGHFPEGCLVPACAVRYGSAFESEPASASMQHMSGRRLGVALTTEIDNSIDVLAAVAGALSGSRWTAQVRCHPTLQATQILPHLGEVDVSRLTFDDGRTLPEFLGEIDALAYGKTTVSFEAAARGLPTLHVRGRSGSDDDPMFGSGALKWTVDTSESLRIALTQIESLDPARRQCEADRARAYVREYLVPVTLAGLDVFVDATGVDSRQRPPLP